ncbi:hypothetical protein K7432_007733 [Basidiobolus ranarum]|uniref:Uncharacterized protein n=1 Tax=Basidiobolus ranarum TaxID=34480 RepID=A0ABR2WSV7_9FUNG
MSSPEPPSDAPISLDSKSKSTSDLTTLKTEIIGAANLSVGDTLQGSALSNSPKKTKQKSSTRFLGKLGSKQFSKVEKEKEKEIESKKFSNPKKSGLVSGLQNFFKSGSLSSKNTPSTGIAVGHDKQRPTSLLYYY